MNLNKQAINISKMKKVGCNLEFENKESKQTYNFTITPKNFKVIYKMLYKRKQDYLLIDNNHNLKLYKTLQEIEGVLVIKDIEINELYFLKNSIYVVINREVFLDLLNGIKKTYNRNTYSEPVYNNNDSNNVKANSFFNLPTATSRHKKPRFDWDEAYMEGLRIFGDEEVEQAEGYADEMKRKHN